MDQFFIKPKLPVNDSYNPSNFSVTGDGLQHTAQYFWKLGTTGSSFTGNEIIDIEQIINTHSSINQELLQDINTQDEYINSDKYPIFPYISSDKIASHECTVTLNSYRSVDIETNSAQSITAIAAGTSPHFGDPLFDTTIDQSKIPSDSPVEFYITRTSTSLEISDKEFTVNDFPNKVIPIKLLLIVQAPGGKGGGYGNVWYSGAGGGGGGCAICLLDFIKSKTNYFKIRISNGTTPQIVISSYKSNGTTDFIINVFNGGNGEEGGGSGGGGGNVYTSGTNPSGALTLLQSIKGAAGGSDEISGSDVGEWSYNILSRGDTDEAYSQSNHTGGASGNNKGGGGGASAHANGGAPSSIGGSGGGGGGGATKRNEEKLGGTGFIRIYY